MPVPTPAPGRRRSLGRQLRPEWMIRDVGLLLLAQIGMSGTAALSGVIVPIYLALIGFDAIKLGTLFAVTALTSAVLTASIGVLSDRLGRKVFIVALPLVTAAAAVIFSLSHAVAVIFACAAIGSFGRGAGAGGGNVGSYAPAQQAYLTDAVSSTVRNTLFARLVFATALGAILGNVLAAIPDLAGHFGLHGAAAYRPAFYAVALLALTAALLGLPIANRKAPPRPSGTRTWSLSRPSWALLLRLWVTNSVNGFAVGFIGPFITYWFYRRYGAGPGTIGLLYTIINLATLASILAAAPVARRLGLVRTVVVSRMFQGVLLIPMVLAPTFWTAGAVYLIRMCAQRVAMPLRQSFVMAMAPPEERGTLAGLSNVPSQGTSVLSPALAGYLFEHISLALPFEIGGVLQVIGNVIFYAFFRNVHPPEERADERSTAPAGAKEVTADLAHRAD
ncbi:MAG TPA: MFS transporter [Thermomicrobiaceae bacterium]|nr:MFS transporter [Thermomicrobiaceae bacterium]